MSKRKTTFKVGKTYVATRTIHAKYAGSIIVFGKELTCVIEDGIKCLKYTRENGASESWHFGQFNRNDFKLA